MLDVRSCWLPCPTPAPSATLGSIRQWEEAFGVTLPFTLKCLLGVQNGGRIERLGSVHELLPLEGIRPLNDDSMRTLLRAAPATVMNGLATAGVPILWMVFPFISNEGRQVGLLCYPEHSLKVEPLLYIWDNGVARSVAQGVEDVLAELIQLSDFPAVDLQEAATLEIIADETLLVPEREPERGVREIRQVLGRRGRDLMLFTREITIADSVVTKEKRTRAVMPFSLQLQSSHVTMSRSPSGSFKGAWSLPIEPRRREEIVFTQSQRTRAGKWQSEELHGEPWCFLLESMDEQRLRALRQAMLPPSLRNNTSPLREVSPPVDHSVTVLEPSGTPLVPRQPSTFPNLIAPNFDAITESLRKMNDSAIRAPRKRLASV